MCCGCCDPSEEETEEEVRHSADTKGPVIDRGCTDICWLLIFLVYCAGFVGCSYKVHVSSNSYGLWHGKDHTGQFCGLGSHKDKVKVYFPRLHLDLLEDPTLQRRYGVCVQECPKQGEVVPDAANGDPWFVPLPTLDLANRCIPYERVKTLNGTAMCAWPACQAIGSAEAPTKPEQVCGLRMDGTDKYWAIGAPDNWLLMGWQQEGVPQEVISQRVQVLAASAAEAKRACEVVVRRDISFKLEQHDAGLTFKLLAQYTGLVFRQAQELYSNLPLILALGLGGSLALSLAIITVFPCCVTVMLYGLIALLFTVLIVVDYILFVQANITDGKIGSTLTGWLGKTGIVDVLEDGLDVVGVDVHIGEMTQKLLQAQDDAQMQGTYQWLATGLAVVIVLLLCLLLGLRGNFAVLVALYNVASRTLREMPSLVLLPFGTLCSLALWTVLLVYTCLGTLTLRAEVLEGWLRLLGMEHPEEPELHSKAKKGMMWVTLFSFLWVYFFHMAIFQITLAGAISKWYFFRNDQSDNAGTGIHSGAWFFGKPLLYALCRAVRYHAGSAAFGSFVLALSTLPRFILEYVDQETKKAQETNPVLQVAIPCVRCLLACWERCLKWLTEYAYINVAVSGRNFCRAAHASVKLLVNHPVQVALDRMASAALQVLACLLVPLCMLVATYYLTKSWLLCGSFVFFLSYMVTRMAIGTYDVCISALMVCAMEDKDKYDGKYAPRELQEAMGVPMRQSSAEFELAAAG